MSNYQIYDLSEEELQALDPTGEARLWMRKLRSHKETKPGSPSPLFRISSEEMVDRYYGLLSKLKLPASYEAYNMSQFGSVKPQGGEIAFTVIEEILNKYYDSSAVSFSSIHPVVIRGRNYLLGQIKSRMSHVGGPTYVKTMGVTGTAGGLPTWSKKGTFDAETCGTGPWVHLYPAVPGTRCLRGKPRTIFMDATSNVRRIDSILSACKKWLVQYFPNYFSAWMNPWINRNKIITKYLTLGYDSVEGDYIGMDQRFRKQIATQVVLPIYQELLPDFTLRLATYVEECFEQPLFMGTYLWTGEHTLFSGLPITNDFETIYTVCLALGVALELGLPLEDILALGDDLTVFIRKSASHPYMEALIQASNESGMLMHPIGEKSMIRRGDSAFCREIFSLDNRKFSGQIAGYYPSCLALNSIVRPERLAGSMATEVSSLLQRLDNCQYNPDFVPLAQLVRRFSKADLCSPANEIPQDWWMRLYGEKWSPQSSAAFRFYKEGKHVIQPPSILLTDF